MLVAAHPRGPAGPLHQPGDALAFELDASCRPEPLSRGAPGGDHGRRPVGLVAPHVRDVDTEEQADLARDRREHLGRRDPAGDQRRHAPQRGLLVREPRRSPRLAPRARRQLADDERRPQEGDQHRPMLRRPGIQGSSRSEEEVVQRQHARQRDGARGNEAEREADRHDGEQVQHAQTEGRHARVQQRDQRGDRGDERRAEERRPQPAFNRQAHARMIPRGAPVMQCPARVIANPYRRCARNDCHSLPGRGSLDRMSATRATIAGVPNPDSALAHEATGLPEERV